jgi:hypothetical protein
LVLKSATFETGYFLGLPLLPPLQYRPGLFVTIFFLRLKEEASKRIFHYYHAKKNQFHKINCETKPSSDWDKGSLKEDDD